MPPLSSFYRLKDNRFLLAIYLTPKASKTRLGQCKENGQGQHYLRVYVTANAESNKANEALIVFLAKMLCLPKASINLIGGHTSSWKLLEMPYSPPLMMRLNSLLPMQT